MPDCVHAVPVAFRTVAMDERRKAMIGCGVVFGIAALVGCSSAMTGGNTGGGGASAAPEELAPVSTIVPATTAAPTTTSTTTTTTTSTTTTLPPAPTIPDTIRTVGQLDVPLQAIGKSSGSEAARVQLRLLELGFWLQAADGDYGLTTSQAVMAFQKYMGFDEPSGRVDEQTALALSLETVRPHARANSGTLVEIDKSKQVLFFVMDASPNGCSTCRRATVRSTPNPTKTHRVRPSLACRSRRAAPRNQPSACRGLVGRRPRPHLSTEVFRWRRCRAWVEQHSQLSRLARMCSSQCPRNGLDLGFGHLADRHLRLGPRRRLTGQLSHSLYKPPPRCACRRDWAWHDSRMLPVIGAARLWNDPAITSIGRMPMGAAVASVRVYH